MLYVKNSHCSYCGNYFDHLSYPRTCPSCRRTSFLNPDPLALLLLPVDDGLLMVRRADPDTHGQLGIPGGYIEVGETWEEAAARELYEETSAVVDATSINHYCTVSTPDGLLICIFGIAPMVTAAALPPFKPNNEVLERLVVTQPTATAFQIHTDVLCRFFTERRSLSQT